MSRRTIPPLALLISALLMLSACTVGPGSTQQPTPTFAPEATPVEEPAINVDVSVDDLSYRQGQPVHFTIRATNQGSIPVELEFPTGQHFDIHIDDGDVIVWRWASGRMFAQAFSTTTLAPGESVEYQAAWDQADDAGEQVGSGAYVARAFIAASPSGNVATAEITIQ